MSIVDHVFGDDSPSALLRFRTDIATLLGFEAPREVASSLVLEAFRLRLRRLSAAEHTLAVVREQLLHDDIDGARLLLADALPTRAQVSPAAATMPPSQVATGPLFGLGPDGDLEILNPAAAAGPSINAREAEGGDPAVPAAPRAEELEDTDG